MKKILYIITSLSLCYFSYAQEKICDTKQDFTLKNNKVDEVAAEYWNEFSRANTNYLDNAFEDFINAFFGSLVEETLIEDFKFSHISCLSAQDMEWKTKGKKVIFKPSSIILNTDLSVTVEGETGDTSMETSFATPSFEISKDKQGNLDISFDKGNYTGISNIDLFDVELDEHIKVNNNFEFKLKKPYDYKIVVKDEAQIVLDDYNLNIDDFKLVMNIIDDKAEDAFKVDYLIKAMAKNYLVNTKIDDKEDSLINKITTAKITDLQISTEDKTKQSDNIKITVDETLVDMNLAGLSKKITSSFNQNTCKSEFLSIYSAMDSPKDVVAIQNLWKCFLNNYLKHPFGSSNISYTLNNFKLFFLGKDNVEQQDATADVIFDKLQADLFFNENDGLLGYGHNLNLQNLLLGDNIIDNIAADFPEELEIKDMLPLSFSYKTALSGIDIDAIRGYESFMSFIGYSLKKEQLDFAYDVDLNGQKLNFSGQAKLKDGESIGLAMLGLAMDNELKKLIADINISGENISDNLIDSLELREPLSSNNVKKGSNNSYSTKIKVEDGVVKIFGETETELPISMLLSY